MKKVIDFKDAAALIPDNAVVSVSSSSGLGCPDRMLKAIGERFEQSGHPRNLTTLHPIAAGDMYGIKGIDHIARPGLLGKIISGSYPSGSSRMAMPEIWQMVTGNKIPAYNVPSGILYDMHRDAAARRPGVLTTVGIDTFVDPIHQGCAMNAKAKSEPIVFNKKFEGEDYLYFPTIIPDVAIIRATSADAHGNLSYEHEGAYLGVLDQAIAVRSNGGIVIAQVKREVRTKSRSAYQIHVPGHLVDYVVVDPDQLQTTGTFYDPSISGEIAVSEDTVQPLPLDIKKIIARRVALELKENQTVNLGFGISSLVPYILLEEGYKDAISWVIEQGAVGGIPLTDFAFGCAANADCIMASPQQFSFFQGGGFDQSLLSFLEIDQYGNVNVSRLKSKPYLTAGCGGFVDITANARKIIFSGLFNAGARFDLTKGQLKIIKEGKFTKLVKDVDHITFSGRRAQEKNQDITYITERCVMKLMPQGLMVTEIMPGIDLQRDILDLADFPLNVAADLKYMDNALMMSGPFGLQLGKG